RQRRSLHKAPRTASLCLRHQGLLMETRRIGRLRLDRASQRAVQLRATRLPAIKPFQTTRVLMRSP
ncbi:MAG TPA: hypothetical protein VIR56_13660, partial [Solimonas sp.]